MNVNIITDKYNLILTIKGKELKLKASDEGIKVEYDGINKLLKGCYTVEKIAEEFNLNLTKDEQERIGQWLDDKHELKYRELRDKIIEFEKLCKRLGNLENAEKDEEYKRLKEELDKIAFGYFGNRFCYECKREDSNLIEHIARKHLGKQVKYSEDDEQLGRDIITAIIDNLDALYPKKDGDGNG